MKNTWRDTSNRLRRDTTSIVAQGSLSSPPVGRRLFQFLLSLVVFCWSCGACSERTATRDSDARSGTRRTRQPPCFSPAAVIS